MPGKAHVPDLFERLIRGQRAGTSRTAGGFARGASPQMTRDRMGASLRGAAGLSTAARLSHVQAFPIADDSESSFTLDFTPIVESWNLMLNGLRVHADEFGIVGRTLTIVDAADLFLGADTQGTPWDLEIQYDYLANMPTSLSSGPEIVSVRYREVTKGDTTVFWPPAYSDSGWTAGAAPRVSFAGGSGGLPTHVYSWNPAFDLQVRAVVEAPAGGEVTITYDINDDSVFFWNGVELDDTGIGTGTFTVPGGDVLASNVMAILGLDTNPVSAWVIASVG